MGTRIESIKGNRTVRQFVKFAIVGASSTAIDWGLHALLFKGFGGSLAEPVREWWVQQFPAISSHPDFDGAFTTFKMVSFLVATMNGFVWNRLWTFRIKSREERMQQFWRFFLVTGAGLFLNTLVASQIHTQDGGTFNYILALGTATFVTMFWNFAGHKLWTFKRRPAPKDG